MNCDEAFEAMTDPSAPDNSALKWHLEFCPRCREMQDVLAPALAMLSTESVAKEDSPANRLPSSFTDFESSHSAPRRFLTPEAVQIAEQTARTLHPARKWFSARHWPRWIAVGALSLLVSLGLYFLTTKSEPARPAHADPIMLANHCLWKQPAPVKTATRTIEPTETNSSRWIVLSCVACHLEHPLE